MYVRGSVVAAVPVAQPQPPVGEDGGVQHVQIHGRPRYAHPAGRVDQDPPARQLGGGPVRFGQRGHDLAQRRAERLVEAERGVRTLGGQDEQGTGLVGGQPGDVGTEAGQQRDAAVPPALGVDGDAGGRERLDIAVDGAYGDFEPLGEFGGRDEAAGLEEQQDREQPVGFHGSEGLRKT